MKLSRRMLMAAGGAGLVSACSGGGGLAPYRGPEVTRVVVMKGARRLHLLHASEVLKSYDVSLGFAPEGHKMVEGDGKTPEGRYYIDRRNPQSAYHLSVGISYPNARDIEVARSLGQSPGGDIFIHGQTKRFQGRTDDWTAGCVAVTDPEIEEIYSMVALGTVIDLFP